ncbi:MAG: pyruvate, phosphate dikinase [Geminicoccaceae bacterium]|nr:MAG: pyruvate, phosphate dikinase [Geminicoccaceae bacterium]
MTQWVYRFGDGTADGKAEMKTLLGGKGANLAEMASLGLPVPSGFTITTEVCTYYYANGKTYPDDLKQQVEAALAAIENSMGTKFGDPLNPLLVSVRSGAPLSMPGMMDTVLNLGLNTQTVEGLADRAQDARFAYDSYRRFMQMYGHVVLGVDHHLFEDALEATKAKAGVSQDTDISVDALRALVKTYKSIVQSNTGAPFPEDPMEQLWGAVGAVFSSWMTARAVTYRRLHDIPAGMGTAVNVQAMVFGNMGMTSATGVTFTRNPSTGERAYYGEYLVNAQGEDVVAGIRTPQPLTQAMAGSSNVEGKALEEVMPQAFAELVAVFERLERHYKDMQDIEFTVERGKLYILQTRNGKRTAPAALKIAVGMVEEGLLTQEEAISRVQPASLDQLLHPTLDPKAPREVITRGLPASPGAVSGKIVFDADTAERRAAAGDAVILVRTETSPDDIHGMHAAKGILTSRGGMTSHAAVVARGMGKPCVCGAGDLEVRVHDKVARVGSLELQENDTITIDGGDGTVMLGLVPTIDPELSGDFAKLMEWADASRTLKVRTNAETPEDVRTALRFGAEGIGLCRTEHMFFEESRILAMREMILAADAEGRRAALAKILPMQKGDFVEIFEIMAGLPVTIRLLDPPLHEFLPHNDEEMQKVADATGVPLARVQRRANELREANPMLGLRGSRVGVLFPEVYEMQARAIFEAAHEVERKSGDTVVPEVMVPLISSSKELELLKKRIDAVAATVAEEQGKTLTYSIGTMIEVPRAAIRADKIAEHAAFFSFGTNDLTQMTLGLSRDDSGLFMDSYLRQEIFAADPFQSLDIEGVGRLIEIARDGGRRTRPDIKIGICGEHGGDPASIFFCQKAGLDYVSCSPYRVPIARLAAAQAALEKSGYSTA